MHLAGYPHTGVPMYLARCIILRSAHTPECAHSGVMCIRSVHTPDGVHPEHHQSGVPWIRGTLDPGYLRLGVPRMAHMGLPGYPQNGVPRMTSSP